MYAIIVTGGKQYKVEAGQAIYVEKLDAQAGDKVTFDKVVFVGGDDTKIGTPFVDGASVEGTVDKQGKEKKVVTFKYKPKKPPLPRMWLMGGTSRLPTLIRVTMLN